VKGSKQSWQQQQHQKKQCLTVPQLWLLQDVLLHRNGLERAGSFIPLIHVNRDTVPRLQPWKEWLEIAAMTVVQLCKEL